jgi:hypothetical protein
MLCPRCHGTHFVLTNGLRLPCPECGGVGEINCCDGLMEQPDPTGDAVQVPQTANGTTCPVRPPVAKTTSDD